MKIKLKRCGKESWCTTYGQIIREVTPNGEALTAAYSIRTRMTASRMAMRAVGAGVIYQPRVTTARIILIKMSRTILASC